MQDDLFWYKENDEDYAMPPLFDGRDLNGDPSEDKFIMSVQTGEPLEDQPKYNLISEGSTNYLEKQWALASKENLKCDSYIDYYELGENFRLEKRNKKCEEHCNDYSCSAPLCACCNGAGTVYAGDPADYSLGNLKVTDVRDHQLVPLGEKHTTSETNFSNQRSSTNDRVGGLNSTHDFNNVKKDSQPNENDNYSFNDDEVIAGEPHEPEAVLDEEGGAISDELLVYDKEDDYEIFNLRIIHRKNRLVRLSYPILSS